MKKLLLALVFSLLTLTPCYAQQGVHSRRFTIAGPDSAINLTNTAIAWHQISWNVTGTASACTVALDTSTNGTTWSAGGAITGQTCTSVGSSSVVNVSANYVRINMTALTISSGGSVSVTWDGWTSNPASGTGGTLTSVTATPPIVVTPNPITATGDISCPTCSTSSSAPGGSNTNVQYNNSGSFGGSANLTFDSTHNYILGLNPANGPANNFFSSFTSKPAALGTGAFSAIFADGVNLNRSGLGCIQPTAHSDQDVCLVIQDELGDLAADWTNDGSIRLTPIVPIKPSTDFPNRALLEIAPSFNGVTLTGPAIDVDYGSTELPSGLDVVRGNGLGPSVILRETIQESDSSYAHYTWNHTTGASNFFAEFMANTGEYQMTYNNANASESITWNVNGSITLNPTTSAGNIDGVIANVGVKTPKYATQTNCSSSASPAVCGSSAAGSVAIPTGTTSSTLQVNTTAVTAVSQIIFYPDDTLGTTLGSITCNSTLATLAGGSFISARNPGVSFTITFNGSILTNKVCGSYIIIN